MRRTPAALAVSALSALALALSTGPASASGSGTYANCTNLHSKYPHGVGRKGAKDHVSGKGQPVTNFYVSTKVYNAAIKQNPTLDKDKDGVACEKH